MALMVKVSRELEDRVEYAAHLVAEMLEQDAKW